MARTRPELAVSVSECECESVCVKSARHLASIPSLHFTFITRKTRCTYDPKHIRPKDQRAQAPRIPVPTNLPRWGKSDHYLYLQMIVLDIM